MPGFGWIPPTPAVRASNVRFAMHAALLATAVVLPRERFWKPGPRVDQGNTPQCAGYTGQSLELSSPNMTSLAKSHPGSQIYALCKARDGAPRADGTTTDALMHVLRDDLKITDEWQWFSATDPSRTPEQWEQDVRAWILGHGPVIIGINWRKDMMEADRGGVIYYSGPVVGGHETLLTGYNADRGLYRGKQSWGASWGDKGLFWLSRLDLIRALTEDGEAVGVLDRRVL